MAFFSLTREQAVSTFRVPVTAGSVNFFLCIRPPLDPNPAHWSEHDSVPTINLLRLMSAESEMTLVFQSKYNKMHAMFSSRNGFLPPSH
ncbi:hypothetical protein SADUNF_Sadunf02G0003100 [Salix dunnii]|uniref:Uncharacterized protein n=1 Tax=Salix dunnii TaxID=1413687 RepID=A0A835N5B6_9ROSI|nr:hypothetical protein SADUNF_Sadunf02G0003100 [Salix dunnii]